MTLVRERFAPLGLSWSGALGFDNGYGLAMLGDRANRLGIASYADLASRSASLTLGVDDEFQARPIDGLQPLLRGYGMRFGAIKQVPVVDRGELFGQLLDASIDVALVHAADGEIDAFDPLLLNDDLGFFSTYDAALLYRDAATAAHPALSNVLDQPTGALSIEQMRELTRRVSLRGEDPRQVARDELIRLRLLDGEATEPARQALRLAVSLSANADGEAGKVLRALRRSFPTRNVQLMRSPDPLGAVERGDARLALVSASAFFAPGTLDAETGQPPLRAGVEAVALVGISYLQAFALEPGLGGLDAARLIATGPEGSSGYRAAQSIIDGLGLDPALLPLEGDTPEALADAMLASGADAAILMQPIGNSTALALLERGLPLLAIDRWTRGNNRIAFPYLQPARLTPADYARFFADADGARPRAGLSAPVETLITQLLLAGPAPAAATGIGDQGPGATFIPRALPMTDLSVRAINAALAPTEEIYPVLPQARALAPQLPQPPDPLNPSPAASLMTALVILVLIWMVWLLLRPESQQAPRKRASAKSKE